MDLQEDSVPDTVDAQSAAMEVASPPRKAFHSAVAAGVKLGVFTSEMTVIYACVGDGGTVSLEVPGSTMSLWEMRSHLLQLHLESVASRFLVSSPPTKKASSEDASSDPDDWGLEAVTSSQPALPLYPPEDEEEEEDETTIDEFISGTYIPFLLYLPPPLP
jgi:hypothetical protein